MKGLQRFSHAVLRFHNEKHVKVIKFAHLLTFLYQSGLRGSQYISMSALAGHRYSRAHTSG